MTSPSFRTEGAVGFTTLALDVRIKEASDLARRLQELSVITVRDATEKQRLHDELRARLRDLSVVADAVVGAALSTAGKRGGSAEARLESQMDRIRTALDDDRPAVERNAALTVLHGVSTGWLRTDLPDEPPMPWDRQCLHWPLAFPEVFLAESTIGFDAWWGTRRSSVASGSRGERCGLPGAPRCRHRQWRDRQCRPGRLLPAADV